MTTTTTHASPAIDLSATSTEALEAIWLDFHTKDAAADFLMLGYATVAGLILELGISHPGRSITTEALIVTAKGRIADLTVGHLGVFIDERIASYQDMVERPMRDDEIASLRGAVGTAAAALEEGVGMHR